MGGGSGMSAAPPPSAAALRAVWLGGNGGTAEQPREVLAGTATHPPLPTHPPLYSCVQHPSPAPKPPPKTHPLHHHHHHHHQRLGVVVRGGGGSGWAVTRPSNDRGAGQGQGGTGGVGWGGGDAATSAQQGVVGTHARSAQVGAAGCGTPTRWRACVGGNPPAARVTRPWGPSRGGDRRRRDASPRGRTITVMMECGVGGRRGGVGALWKERDRGAARRRRPEERRGRSEGGAECKATRTPRTMRQPQLLWPSSCSLPIFG